MVLHLVLDILDEHSVGVRDAVSEVGCVIFILEIVFKAKAVVFLRSSIFTDEIS